MSKAKEVFDGGTELGSYRVLTLDKRPADSDSIEIINAETEDTIERFEYNPDENTIVRSGGFPPGNQNIVVKFTTDKQAEAQSGGDEDDES